MRINEGGREGREGIVIWEESEGGSEGFKGVSDDEGDNNERE